MIVSRFPLSYSIYCIALKQIIEMFVRKLNLNVSSLQFIICKYVFNQWTDGNFTNILQATFFRA